MPLPGSAMFERPEEFGMEILTKEWEKYKIGIERGSRAPWTHRLTGVSRGTMENNRERLKEYLFNEGLSNVPAYNASYSADLMKGTGEGK